MPVWFLEVPKNDGAEAEWLTNPQGPGHDLLRNPKAGEPAPLTSVGIPVLVPVMIGKEVGEEVRTVQIAPAEQPVSDHDWEAAQTKGGKLPYARIIPGTRVVETIAPPVMARLMELGYQVVDPPKRLARTRGRDQKAGE